MPVMGEPLGFGSMPIRLCLLGIQSKLALFKCPVFTFTLLSPSIKWCFSGKRLSGFVWLFIFAAWGVCLVCFVSRTG